MTTTPLPEPPSEPPAKPRRLVNTAVVAALAGGGVVGAVVGAPLISAAQDDDPTGSTEPIGTDDDESTGDDAARDESGGRRDGDADRERCGPRHGGFHLPFIAGPWLGTAAEELELEPEELRERLADGDTLADVAEEQGVDTDQLSAAIVDDVTATIDEQVEQGRIDEENAQELKDALSDQVADLIDGDWPSLGSLRDLGDHLPELPDDVEAWIEEHGGPDHDAFDDGDRPVPPWSDQDDGDRDDADRDDQDSDADDDEDTEED